MLYPHKSSLLLLMCVLRMSNHCQIIIPIIVYNFFLKENVKLLPEQAAWLLLIEPLCFVYKRNDVLNAYPLRCEKRKFAQKGYKNEDFLLFTNVYPKINMLLRQFLLENNLPTHVRENIDFPWQMPSVEENLEY